MILDLRNKFCNEQVVCNNGAEASDNHIKWGAVISPSVNRNLILRLIVTTTFDGMAEGMRVALQDDAADTFNSGTLKEHTASPLLKPAQLKAGTVIDIPLTNLSIQGYCQLMFTPVTNNASAGAITAGLV